MFSLCLCRSCYYVAFYIYMCIHSGCLVCVTPLRVFHKSFLKLCMRFLRCVNMCIWFGYPPYFYLCLFVSLFYHLKYRTRLIIISRNEPRHEISNNVVCATSKASDQPAHTRSLIRAFASRLNIL